MKQVTALPLSSFSTAEDHCPGTYRIKSPDDRWYTLEVIPPQREGNESWLWKNDRGAWKPTIPAGLLYGPLVDGWIPVEWGLPDTDDQVLLMHSEQKRCTGSCADGVWNIDYYADDIMGVTHWQPLPPAPKDEHPFTVVGNHADGSRFADHYCTPDAFAAERQAAEDHPGLTVSGVFPGHLEALL